MKTLAPDDFVPLSAAAFAASLEPEHLRRLILRGAVVGEMRRGRWYCSLASLKDWANGEPFRPLPEVADGAVR